MLSKKTLSHQSVVDREHIPGSPPLTTSKVVSKSEPCSCKLHGLFCWSPQDMFSVTTKLGSIVDSILERTLYVKTLSEKFIFNDISRQYKNWLAFLFHFENCGNFRHNIGMKFSLVKIIIQKLILVNFYSFSTRRIVV